LDGLAFCSQSIQATLTTLSNKIKKANTWTRDEREWEDAVGKKQLYTLCTPPPAPAKNLREEQLIGVY